MTKLSLPRNKKHIRNSVRHIPQANQLENDFVNSPVTNHLIYGSATSVGLERSQNEDSYIACVLSRNVGQTSLDVGIFIVADGMGGHQDGEIASVNAVNSAFTNLMKYYLDTSRSEDSSKIPKAYEDLIMRVFSDAQDTILKTAPGGGTTLTIAYCIDNLVVWGHVGDSRLLYLNRSDELNQITKDHSLVGRLIELGQITEQAAENHPQKNVLIRALGQVDGFKVDVGHFYIETGEQLLICSDGLWGCVAKLDILKNMQSDTNPNTKCESLVKTANANGGLDNISVVIVRYQ